MERNLYDYYSSYGTESQHQQVMENYLHHQYSMAALDPVYYYNIPAFVELNQHGVNNSNYNHQTYHQMQHQHHSPPPTPKSNETASSSSTSSTSPTSLLDFKIKCESCGKELTSRKRYQNHYVKCVDKKKNPKTFNCTQCAQEFRVKKSYEKHISEAHGELARIINVNLGNQRNQEVEQPKKVSIFHSIDLMAVSDSK